MSKEESKAGLTEPKKPTIDPEVANPEVDTDWKPSRHQQVIFLTLAIVSFMVALDANIIVTSLDTITAALHGSTDQGFWVGTSYLLCCAVTIPFIGALSDIFGRPPFLLFCLLLFTVGSVICGSAQSMTALLVGRCIQGVGGGGITILCAVIVTDIVPLRFRPKWYGIIQGAWVLGSTIGPVIGGAFSEKASWRWVFYIMLPICGIAFVLIPMVLTLKPKTETLREKLARVDWIGGFLFISSSTSFLIAISWGGTQHSWGSAQTLCPLIIGLFGVIAALVYEGYIAQEPFLRRSLFHDISSCATYWGAMSQGLILYGQLYYGPLYLLSCLQSSPIEAGVRLLPITLILTPSAVITGVLITKYNRYLWAIWIGWSIIILSNGTFLVLDQHSHLVQWVFLVMPLGVGHGMVLTSLNFTSQAQCKPADHGAAAAMYMFMRHLGTALGVGLGGSVFTNTMKSALKSKGLDTDIANNAEGFIPTMVSLPPEDPQKDLILGSYASGIHGVWYFWIGLSVFAALVSLLIKKKDMNVEIETDHKLQKSRNLVVSKILSDNPTVVSTPENGLRDSLAATTVASDNKSIGEESDRNT